MPVGPLAEEAGGKKPPGCEEKQHARDAEQAPLFLVFAVMH